VAFIVALPARATLLAAQAAEPTRAIPQAAGIPMGDLIEGRWQTPKESAFMRALDLEILRLTRMVEALREAHACERGNRSRRSGEIIPFSPGRTTNGG